MKKGTASQWPQKQNARAAEEDERAEPEGGVADGRPVLPLHQLLELLAGDRRRIPVGGGEAALLGPAGFFPDKAIVPARGLGGCGDRGSGAHDVSCFPWLRHLLASRYSPGWALAGPLAWGFSLIALVSLRGVGVSRVDRPRSRLGLEDVARRAGVGLATVDRVLNERGSVSAATEQRVIQAARELGLRRVLPTPHARQMRIEVMLARQETPFMRRLTEAMTQVAATLDRSIVILRTMIDMRDPAQVGPRIAACRADGIIVYCEEHPANVAAIAQAAGAGRPVICVVTDVPDSPRADYVGIDHAKAGRTAAFFVARMGRPAGAALIISTSIGFRAHKQRIDGFRAALALHSPDVAVAPVMTSGDDSDRAYHLLTQALRRHPGCGCRL